MRKFIVYVYYKKQYINAKKGLPQTIRNPKHRSASEFDVNSFLLTKEYALKEVALMVAIHRVAQVSIQASEELLFRREAQFG